MASNLFHLRAPVPPPPRATQNFRPPRSVPTATPFVQPMPLAAQIAQAVQPSSAQYGTPTQQRFSPPQVFQTPTQSAIAAVPQPTPLSPWSIANNSGSRPPAPSSAFTLTPPTPPSVQTGNVWNGFGSTPVQPSQVTSLFGAPSAGGFAAEPSGLVFPNVQPAPGPGFSVSPSSSGAVFARSQSLAVTPIPGTTLGISTPVLLGGAALAAYLVWKYIL